MRLPQHAVLRFVFFLVISFSVLRSAPPVQAQPAALTQANQTDENSPASVPTTKTLTIAPTSLAFGNVAVGTTQTLTLGLGAVGSSVTISSISSSSAQFTLQGVTLPLTIAGGKGTQINVAFKPTKNVKTWGTLLIKSNASNASAKEAMSGTGTSSTVSLSWIASTSSGVTGYNVYRATTSTGAMTKVKSLNPDTDYADFSVTSGATYYYATTAVNSSGQESSYSNKVKAIVP